MNSDPYGDVQRDATFALGLFILAWSSVEGTMDVAISKQLKISPLEGSIITAGLPFRAKATILKGLLIRDKIKNKEAIGAVNTLLKKPDRNDILHGIAGANENGLVFTRRKSDGTFFSIEKPYTTERLLRLAAEVSQIVQRFGVTEEEYRGFFHVSHNAQIRLK